MNATTGQCEASHPFTEPPPPHSPQASGICFLWHAGWQAQQLPGPWFRADAILAPNVTDMEAAAALKGMHRICSAGTKVG